MQHEAGNWRVPNGLALHGAGHAAGRGATVRRLPQRYTLLDYAIDYLAPVPFSAMAGAPARRHEPVRSERAKTPAGRRPLYTPEERRRRDTTPWTKVQAILAPVQFLVLLISVGLVVTYLVTGQGYEVATASIVLKTAVLYAIMWTGSIWEKRVFDRYLFAPSFYWEDMVSMLVLALHTAYLIALIQGWGTPAERMVLALVAYASYAVNATQFLLKLRAARREEPLAMGEGFGGGGALGGAA